MKLDGAVEPRHGAPCIHGSSSANNVVKVFEQRKGNKQCETSTPSMHKQTQQQPQCADEKKANATTAAAASAALSSKFVSNNSNSDTNNNNKQSVCHIKCNTNNNNNDDSDTKNNAKVESIKRAVKQAKQRATEIKQNKRQKTIDVVDFKSLTGNATSPIAADAAASDNANAAFIKRNQKMRVQQSLMAARKRHVANIDGGNGSGFDTLRHVQCVSLSRAVGGINMSLYKIVLCLVSIVVVVLPHHVLCDDGDNFFGVNSFSMGPETTTPEFDYASRGQKKFGDKCDNTLECGFPGSICDPKKKSCQCTEDLPVTNHFDKCGKEAAINESCFFNEQCEVKYFQTECRDGRCICRFEMMPFWGKDGSVECKAGREKKNGNETYIDPAMIGVLVGMALMFIIICVVLRLFSQARWHDNRTIFNTPNPRLMNVSLLRDSKLLHGQERRGSRMSVRAPSRQPSMASLRPHSPNPSLGKTGSQTGSHGSNASATSVRSTRSNSVAPGKLSNHERKASSHHHHHQPQQQQHSQNQEPLITNITANPVAESVTVEIIESGK